MQELFQSGGVRGMLHRPATGNGDGVILTHGAGSDHNAVLLTQMAGAWEEAGFHVLRYDLPFRQAGGGGAPGQAQQARDRDGVRAAAGAMRSLVSGRVIAGGHSYGGRQTAWAASEDSTLAGSLVLFSYPLHPPKQPLKLRTSFFPNLRTPTLFVHGTRDPFGSVEEMRTHIAAVPAKTDLFVVEGGAHDLRRAPGLAVEIISRMLF